MAENDKPLDQDTAAAPDAPIPEAEPSPAPVDPDPAPEPEPQPAPAPRSAPASARRRGGAGVAPLLLGGVLAAAIGFVAAKNLQTPGWPLTPTAADPAALAQRLDAADAAAKAQAAAVAQVQQALSALSAKVAAADALPARLDAAAREQTAALASLRDDLTARTDSLQKAVDDLTARIATGAPAGASAADGGAPATGALAALQSTLEAQKQQNAELAQQIADVAAKANARIDAAAQQATALKTDAEAIARAALERAALTRVQTALDVGGSFAPALADLTAQGVTPPAALAAAAAKGVPTLAELQATFPAAARAGLAASVKATMGTGLWARAGAFLRTQTGLRSLTPREGSDPDAVLSRAEAALRRADLPAALTEIGALPEAGRTAMADWLDGADRRAAALAAADALAQSLAGK